MEVKGKVEYNFSFFVVLAIIIGYFQLFRLDMFPREMMVLSRVIAGVIILLFLILKNIYREGEEIPKNFTLPVILILLSAFTSPLIALTVYNQPYFLSVWVSYSLFFFFLFFLLHSIRIEKRALEKIIINIGLIVIGVFYLQYLIYPTRIFSEEVRMSIDRGTLRLWVPGMTFTIIAYFYYLDKFFKKNHTRYIIIALMAFSIFILQATRQRIAALTLLTIIFLFRSKEVKSRLLITVIVGIGMVALFFSFYDLFMEMFLVTQDQATDEEDNVRIRAARYFLTEFMPNNLAYILGNADGHLLTPYGMKLFTLSMVNGFYLSDIGLIGDYVRYGAIFLLGAIILLVKLIRIKVDPRFEYLKYYIFLIILNLFTGSGTFGSPNIEIILIAYLFDLGNYKYQMNGNQ